METVVHSYQSAASRDHVRVSQRFWAKVNKSGPVLRPELGPCWIWIGSRKTGGNPSGIGYGEMRLLGRIRFAHRVAWLVTHGEMPTLHVLHKCDGGRDGCVRPDHLFLGTNADNMADKAAKGRCRPSMLKGQDHGSAKVSEEQVLEARAAKANGESVASIARRLGLTHSGAWALIHGLTWKHLPIQSTQNK